MMRMRHVLILLGGMLAALGVHADGLQSLETFVKGVTSGRADFTQVVTAPAREGQAARSKTSSGSFEFSRPSRFRFSRTGSSSK